MKSKNHETSVYAIFQRTCFLLLLRPEYFPGSCDIRATNTTNGISQSRFMSTCEIESYTFHLMDLLVFLTYSILTYSMEQSPSREANRFSASQGITRILRSPKVHYHVHKRQPPVPILSHLDPVHTPTSYLLKCNLNIILPSRPGSPK